MSFPPSFGCLLCLFIWIIFFLSSLFLSYRLDAVVFPSRSSLFYEPVDLLRYTATCVRISFEFYASLYPPPAGFLFFTRVLAGVKKSSVVFTRMLVGLLLSVRYHLLGIDHVTLFWKYMSLQVLWTHFLSLFLLFYLNTPLPLEPLLDTLLPTV